MGTLSQTATYILILKAEAGNRIFQGVKDEDPRFSNLDGDKSVSFKDLDSGLQIMKPDAFTAVDGCVLRPNWKMAACSQKYAKVGVISVISGSQTIDEIKGTEVKRSDMFKDTLYFANT